MKENGKLCAAVGGIAWAHILLLLNFNLGTLNVLPDWLGYVLILRALPALAEERESAALLRPLGLLLTAWEAFLWTAKLLGFSPEPYILGLVAAAVSLYFHFQLLTELAAAAEAHGCPERKRLLVLRTVRTVMICVLALPLDYGDSQAAAWLFIALGLVVAVWICRVLFSLRASLRGREDGGAEAGEAP